MILLLLFFFEDRKEILIFVTPYDYLTDLTSNNVFIAWHQERKQEGGEERLKLEVKATMCLALFAHLLLILAISSPPLPDLGGGFFRFFPSSLSLCLCFTSSLLLR